MSALDIPPPPVPWEGRRLVQVARQEDAAALRATLRPRRNAWRSVLLALPALLFLAVVLAIMVAPLLPLAGLALVAAR